MVDGVNGQNKGSRAGVKERKLWGLEAVLRMILAVIGLQLLAGLMLQAPKGVNPEWDLTENAPFFVLVLGQTVFQVGVLVAIQIFLLSPGRMSWSEGFGLKWSRHDFGWGASVGVAAIFLGLGFGELSGWVMRWIGLESQAQSAVEAFSRYPNWGHQVYLTISAVVLAPLVEELLFRGVLFQTLYRSGHVHWAYWGASALFAVAHGLPQALVSMMVLGLLFSWVFQRQWNLGAAVVAHSLFNAVNLILIFFWK